MAQLSIPLTVLSTNDGFISGYVDVPGHQSANNLTIQTFADFAASTPIDASFPAVFHVRQGDFTEPSDSGFPDQFSTQLIQYLDRIGPQGQHAIVILLRLRRLDQDSGWGQSLHIDVLLKLAS